MYMTKSGMIETVDDVASKVNTKSPDTLSPVGQQGTRIERLDPEIN